MKKDVKSIIAKYNKDQTRLMDILIDIQDSLGFISPEAIDVISEELNLSQVDVEQTISFYHFFSMTPLGKYNIYLNNSAVANMMGCAEVARVFEEEAGSKFGEVSKDGLIGMFYTSCIGMNDQEPAAIINGMVFTRLTKFRAREIIRDIKEGKNVEEMYVASYGDGANSNQLIKSVVSNNIRKIGPILSPKADYGSALKKIIKLSPDEVIDEVKLSNIRGRGGAGFPTGLKWEFCRKAPGDRKYIFCNADEGEPGTFKDRVLLTERPKRLLEGMAIAGYAVGAEEGIIYLRYEYKYLEEYLENVLKEAREANFLGKDICKKKGFNFDVRIQFGAGAYVCGEESALIESAEGKRGEPRDRPPFPVEKGYLNKPTIVNNVETLSAVTQIINNGGEWYRSFGTRESTGTKVLSVSGDCLHAGVYEVEWGFSVNDILDLVGTMGEVQAVQVGGPSGRCIAPYDFNRILGYEDLATGGSLIIIGKQRDLLKDIVLNFMDFFVEESCGSCTPCRSLSVIYREKLKKILNGRGVQKDLDDMYAWRHIMKGNRCGLGQTALNPILTTLRNFPELYEARIQKNKSFDEGFDIHSALKESFEITGRKSF
ncbi:MAG: NAD(P)H-dependent oxidoreductase subunit E [Cyclobacteriaceae bacterium]|jgi:[NiFe] hydrogenase diaphorase moiety large subunit